jgi:uncharacterized protein (UPF0212 family)
MNTSIVVQGTDWPFRQSKGDTKMLRWKPTEERCPSCGQSIKTLLLWDVIDQKTILLLKQCGGCEFTDELVSNKQDTHFAKFWCHYWKNGREACPECGAAARACYVLDGQDQDNSFPVAQRCPKCGWFHDETEMVLNQGLGAAM